MKGGPKSSLRLFLRRALRSITVQILENQVSIKCLKAASPQMDTDRDPSQQNFGRFAVCASLHAGF